MSKREKLDRLFHLHEKYHLNGLEEEEASEMADLVAELWPGKVFFSLDAG